MLFKQYNQGFNPTMSSNPNQCHYTCFKFVWIASKILTAGDLNEVERKKKVYVNY